MLEDMNLEDDETQKTLERFEKHLDKHFLIYQESSKAKGIQVDYGKVVNRSIVDCFKNRILVCDLTALLGEIMTFAYVSYTEVIIDFIHNPELDAGLGVMHAIIFSSLIWLNMVVRNSSANLNIRLALTIKKCMQLSLY